jgi:hypothetical protein
VVVTDRIKHRENGAVSTKLASNVRLFSGKNRLIATPYKLQTIEKDLSS